MKKSKVMKALLVFGMSMVTATAIVGITACDEEHTHVDENKDGKCDICSTDMPKEGGGDETLKVDVEKVELNKNSLTLEIGGEETLTATVTPDTATDKTVTWSVEPAGIVTVTNGKVEAIAAGDAVVTATADGKKATCNVKVNAPAPKPEVTEEEWQAALSTAAFTNFSARLTMSDDTEHGLELRADLDNNKYRYFDNSGTDYYFAKESDDKYYKYEKGAADEDYTKTEITQSDYEGQLSSLEHMSVLLFKDSFDSFTYDSENNEYVGDSVDIGDENTYGIVFRFDNGKLVYADIDFGEEARMILEYSQYGGIAITLPTVGGEQPVVGEEVTAEQWAELMQGATKFTIDVTSSGTPVTKIKIDGDKRSQENSQGKQIFVKDGSTYSQYTYDNDTWTKSDLTQSVYEQYTDLYAHMLSFFQNDFSSFTYSEGAYTATAIDKTADMNSELQNVEIKFADGALTSVKFDSVSGEPAQTVSYAVSAVGSTTIDLPPVGGGDEQEVPEITEWATVGDPIYGEVHENETDYIYHHIYLNDIDAKAYDFDSYEATVKVDGSTGEVVQCNPFSTDDINAHAYHLHIRIKANRYQTAEFTIDFKKDGKTVATGTYTRVGDKEVTLDSVAESVSVGDSVTINVTSVNGSTDLTDKTISWSIADTVGTGVASIPEDSHGSSVEVSALAEGKATLTCTVGEGQDAFSKNCVITVVEGEVVITVVDVSEKVTFNNDFTTGTGNAVQIYFNLQDAKYADLVQQIDPSKTTVAVTIDEQDSTGKILRKEWQGSNNYNLWLQVEVGSDWSHGYVFRFSFKNAKGDEVAYGNYNRIAPKSLELDKTTVNLTLKDGETVTDTLTATTKKVEGEVQWSIDDEGVATITDNGDGTITVTAVAKGTATITATVDGLTKTCAVNVLEDGEEAPVTTITEFSKFEGPYGENYYKFRFEETDANVDKYPDIKASFDHTNVDGVLTAHREFFQGGGAKTYIVTVKFNSAPVSGTTYKIDLCDASNNILATFSWTAD